MNEIGLQLKSTREANGVSIQEASEDLKIKEIVLTNIEEGNIGCFKDMFVLQNYIQSYSKYLGIDPEEMENEFNEYIFEYTSKIPKRKIEKAIKYKNRIEKNDDRVCSPYTNSKEKSHNYKYYIFYSFGVLILMFIIFFIIKVVFYS